MKQDCLARIALQRINIGDRKESPMNLNNLEIMFRNYINNFGYDDGKAQGTEEDTITGWACK